jgi:hypothetical protein
VIGSISRWRRGVFFVLYISWKYSGFRPVGDDMCDTECDTPQIRLDTPCDTHFDSFGPFGLYLYRGSSQLESPLLRQRGNKKFQTATNSLFPRYVPRYSRRTSGRTTYSTPRTTASTLPLPVQTTSTTTQYYKLPVQLPVQPVTSFQCGTQSGTQSRTQCGTQLFPSSHYPTHTTNPHPTIPPTYFPLPT